MPADADATTGKAAASSGADANKADRPNDTAGADKKAPSKASETGTRTAAPIKASTRSEAGPRASVPFGAAEVKVKHQTVAAGGSPREGDANNTCTPDIPTLEWQAIDGGATWKVDVTALKVSGQLNVKPWPSSPSSMTTPNTANPVDGGNVNNTEGSANKWDAVVADMANYHTAGGGAGPNWHWTEASKAHEWEHWNTDWLVDSIQSAAGGNWSAANAKLDALSIPKADAKDAAEAKTKLTATVNAEFRKFSNAAVRRWNAIPDTPGVAGSRGYDAGAAKLKILIDKTNDYATTKGWKK